MSDPTADEILHLEQLAFTLRRRERVLEAQTISYGILAVPTHLVLELEDVRGELARTLADLRRLQPGRSGDQAPYVGLLTFQETDTDRFFGRDLLVADLLQHTQSGPFLAVLGASGSGKSSAVRAGLIPLLKGGALAGSDQWRYAILRPGARPLDSLAAELAKLQGSDLGAALALSHQLAESSRALLIAADMLLERVSGQRLVLVVDQFEEIWTLAPAEPDAREVWLTQQHRPFVQLLLTAAAAPDSPLLIVIAMRADFLHRAAEQNELARLIAEHLAIVSPMTAAELREAIVRPADLAGGGFEPGLVEALIEQIAGQAGALPLLEYTLLELWKQRTPHGTMSWDVFHALGGVEGALAARADTILAARYTPDQQAELRQVLLRLVQPGEGTADTRRRARLDDLVPAGQSVDELHALLKPLTDERLLTTSRDLVSGKETVEVSHEALIHAWPTFGLWIQQAREDLRVQLQLETAAQEWQQSGEAADFLWSGLRLATAEAWLTRAQARLNARDLSFLEASRTAEQAHRQAEQAARQRELTQAQVLVAEQAQRADAQRSAANRLRYLVAALAVFLVVAIGLTAFAYNRQAAAMASLTNSERLRLAAEANIALERGESGNLPALLAIRSLLSGYTPQADAALARALERGFIRQTFKGNVGGVAFSPDGKQVLTGNGNVASLWDTQTGQELRQFKGHTAGVVAVAFSPDGNSVLTGSYDRSVRLWDTRTGQELGRFEGHTNYVLGLAFSPNGKLILTASYDGTARLWDIQTGRQLRQLVGHTAGLDTVAFSPDGKYVLTGSVDKSARLWDVQTGKELRRFEGHTDEVFGVAFSPDGKYVLTGSFDKTARLWDVQTGQELRQFTNHTNIIWGVAFSPDGKSMLTGSSDKTARLWDVQTGRQLRIFIGAPDLIARVAFSPDGKQILADGQDGIVRLWDIYPESEPQIFSGHTNRIWGLALSSDGRQLLTAGWDNTARLWDAQAGQELRVFSGHTEPVNAVAFSPDGKLILTGSNDDTARLWDRQTGQELRQFIGDDPATVDGVAFSPDGHQILAATGNVVYLWDSQSGQQLRKFTGHTDIVVSAVFSPDGKSILTAGRDKTARLWDAQTGQELRQFTGHTDSVNSARFSLDGTKILTASTDKTVRLWDARTGAQQRVLTGHTGAVLSAVFSPDGRYVLSGSVDTTTYLWDAQTGEQMRVFSAHTNAVTSVAFSLDSQSIFTGSWDGTVRRWRIDYHDAIRLACAKLPRDLTDEERRLFEISDDKPTCTKE